MPTEHNPETGSTSLKRMILGQAMEATAIPIVLFSSDTLAGGDEAEGQPDDVAAAAKDLDIDLDGMRNAAMFGAEECANLGLKAYFFPLFDHYDAELANVTDDEWRQIATMHEIGFHTASHAAVTEVTQRTVQREVVEPMVRIEAIAGYRPRIGAWKGGSRFDPGMVGDQTARAYGVRFLVSNWSIERVPPELDPSGDGP